MWKDANNNNNNSRGNSMDIIVLWSSNRTSFAGDKNVDKIDSNYHNLKGNAISINKIKIWYFLIDIIYIFTVLYSDWKQTLKGIQILIKMILIIKYIRFLMKDHKH